MRFSSSADRQTGSRPLLLTRSAHRLYQCFSSRMMQQGQTFACDVVLSTGQDDDVKCTVLVRAGCSRPLEPSATVRYQIAFITLEVHGILFLVV